jgi:hypothetical protein
MPSYFCKRKKRKKKAINFFVRETTKEDAYITSLKFHKLLLFTAEVIFKKNNDYSTTHGLPNLKKLPPQFMALHGKRTHVVGK